MKIQMVIITDCSQQTIVADDISKEFNISSIDLNSGVEDFVRCVLEITKEWPEICEDCDVFDGIHYKIECNDGQNTKQFIGINNTPDNFGELIGLINFYAKPKEKKLEQKTRYIENKLRASSSHGGTEWKN